MSDKEKASVPIRDDENKLETERDKINSLTDFGNMYDFKKDFTYDYRTQPA